MHERDPGRDPIHDASSPRRPGLLAWMLAVTAIALGGCTLTTSVDTGYIQACVQDADCPDGQRCGPEGFCGPAELFADDTADTDTDDTATDDTDTGDTTVSDTAVDPDVTDATDTADTTQATDAADTTDVSSDTVDADTADTADVSSDTAMDDVADTADVETDVAGVELPACTTDPRAYLASATFAIAGNGTDTYREPTAAERDALEASLTAALAGDAAGALGHAATAQYGLCAWPDGAGRLLGFYPLVDGEGGLLWIVRDTPDASDLVLEAAQPLGNALPPLLVDLFDDHNARAVLVTTAAPCSSEQLSGCSGTADCATGGHRVSDVQHSDTSYFQAAHAHTADTWPDTVFLVIYNLAATNGVVISNGTTAGTQPSSPLARFTDALVAGFPAVTVRTCSSYTGSPTVETDAALCALDSAQGLYLNGAADVCTGSATGASERFVGITIVSALGADEVAVSQAVGALIAP